VGLTWLGPDTIAVLTDLPDSLAPSGVGRIMLTYQDRNGALLRTESFTGMLTRGLAFDGEFLWSCGDEQDGGALLYQIHPDTLNVLEAYPTPGHHPCGVAWDGESVWVADRDSGRLDRYDRETGRVTRSVLPPAFAPYGLAATDRTWWVSDSGTGRLYRLTGQRGRWTGTVEPGSFAFRGQDVLLAHDGVRLWYVPPGHPYAYQVLFE
jgi:DNA-binding beta-propeller fold protein YncE